MAHNSSTDAQSVRVDVLFPCHRATAVTICTFCSGDDVIAFAAYSESSLPSSSLSSSH